MIMGCTTIDEIIKIINQLQAMSWLNPAPAPSQAQTNPFQILSAQQDDSKTVSIEKETTILHNTPDWPERIGDRIANKVNDKISDLAQNFPCNACCPPFCMDEHSDRDRDRNLGE